MAVFTIVVPYGAGHPISTPVALAEALKTTADEIRGDGFLLSLNGDVVTKELNPVGHWRLMARDDH